MVPLGDSTIIINVSGSWAKKLWDSPFASSAVAIVFIRWQKWLLPQISYRNSSLPSDFPSTAEFNFLSDPILDPGALASGAMAREPPGKEAVWRRILAIVFFSGEISGGCASIGNIWFPSELEIDISGDGGEEGADEGADKFFPFRRRRLCRSFAGDEDCESFFTSILQILNVRSLISGLLPSTGNLERKWKPI